jgi:hypothetical protein
VAQPPPQPSAADREEARDRVVQRLGLVSMVIWVVVVIGLMWFLFPTRSFKPTVGVTFGALAFALAIIPWIAYPFLLERELRQRVAPRGRPELPPTTR